jgi:hypothetical protein
MSEINNNESGEKVEGEVEVDIDLKEKEVDVDLNKEGDKPVEKPAESPADRVARLQRQLKRAKADAGIEDEVPTKKTSKKDELDYGAKAFLVANGIKGNDEMTLAKEVMTSSGKSLEEVIENKYFQAELKEMRELKATKDAIPTGSKRSGQTQSNEVDYWIAKGQLPPVDQRELRQKVVNARINTEKSKNNFTSNPVAGK